MLAMPVFFALTSLVIDGGNIFVHKRNIQVAADAASLAMSQSIDLTTSSCNSACQNQGLYYANKNGANIKASTWQPCDAVQTTNCWVYPYVDKSGTSHNDQVEVRLRAPVTTFIAGVIGIYSANVSARAVASANPVLQTSTTPGSSTPDQTIITPGATHTTTDPDEVSGGSGVAFAMSRLCTAISYTGAGAKNGDPVLGAFATNGGLDFQGNAPKKITWLGYDKSRCLSNPASPPSGTSACTSLSWGDASESNNLCAKTLVNLNKYNTLPINWPLPPPTLPTPKSGTWNASTDYPSKCINLGSGNLSFNVGTQPAGIYCATGATTNLQISGVEPAGSDGHTFFALGGATIGVSSNTSVLKFYWPSPCGTRPTTRATSFNCFGNVSGYDSQTLLDATYTSADGKCAVCLSGQNNSLTGDIFAAKPDVFPPSLTQTGGLVSINGGALTAGSGFFESWLLNIGGNTGSYSGTGASIVIPGATHTTTDPSTTTVITGTTIPGSTQTSTIGTTVGLGE